MNTELSKARKRYHPFTGELVHYRLTRMRCVQRNDVTIRIIDRRESYHGRRVLAGCDAAVSDSDKLKALTALKRHVECKLRAKIGDTGSVELARIINLHYSLFRACKDLNRSIK